eukprot:3347176-Rhodomonas_salina.1
MGGAVRRARPRASGSSRPHRCKDAAEVVSVTRYRSRRSDGAGVAAVRVATVGPEPGADVRWTKESSTHRAVVRANIPKSMQAAHDPGGSPAQFPCLVPQVGGGLLRRTPGH